MEIINLGIFAHVDAGKTTITENILYLAGIIKTAGRVDHGSTFTDSLEIERSRGISIKSTPVSFDYRGIKINLIDTPGHVDFIAEVERSLQVLDCAILVISAKEGIQSQTHVIFNALKSRGKPTLLFINKLDRKDVDLRKIYSEISIQLGAKTIIMQTVKDMRTDNISLENYLDGETIHEALRDQICELDDSLLDMYVTGIAPASYQLRHVLLSSFHCNQIYPIYHGAALQGIGIQQLLDGMVELMPRAPSDTDKSLSLYVFKIERNEHMQKRYFFRIFEGTLSVRERYNIAGREDVVKVKRIESLSNGKSFVVNSISAGDIGVLTFLDNLQIGDFLGAFAKDKGNFKMPTPTLQVYASSCSPTERQRLLDALVDINEEDPLIDLRIDPACDEISLNLFGEVQMEIIKNILMHRYGIAMFFSEPITILKERPKGVGKATICIGEKLNPFNASISLIVEPAPLGAGLIYESRVSFGYITKSFQTAVYEGICSTLSQGLLGWEVTDLKVSFIGAFYDSVTSTPADFRNLSPLVFMEALVAAGTELLEPILLFKLLTPSEFSGRALSDLQHMRATFSEPILSDGILSIEGTIPVDTSKSYLITLSSQSKGRAIFSTSFYGYQQFRGETRTKARTGLDARNRALYLKQKGNAIKFGI